jgi:Ca2+-binding RTX toxin-like protein
MPNPQSANHSAANVDANRLAISKRRGDRANRKSARVPATVAAGVARAAVESLELRRLLSNVVTFTIDPTQSSLTLSGNVDGVNIDTPQGGSSLTDAVSGTISADLEPPAAAPTSITFESASISPSVQLQGSEPDGDPAQFAVVEQVGIIGSSEVFDSDLENLSFSLTSSAIAVNAGGSFNNDDNVTATSGQLNLGNPANESEPLSGAGSDNLGNTASLTTSGGTTTLMLPVSIDFQTSDSQIELDGTIVADAPYAPAAVTAGVANNVLTVLGTGGNDIIQVQESDGSINVLSDGGSVGTFATTGISQIQVYGGEGADLLKLGGNVTIPALLSGGDGADTLVAANANDTLEGGPGFDSITATAAGALAFGGMGADTLIATAAGETLGGGKGADSVVGSGGGDSLDGGAGNDTINASVGAETVDGGLGRNDVISNPADTVINDDATNAVAGGTSDGVDASIVGGASAAGDTLFAGNTLFAGGALVAGDTPAAGLQSGR